LDFYVDANFPKNIDQNPLEDELLQRFCKEGNFNKKVALI
jgi:hypothetical protein